jgi:hypothetical protein
MVPVMVPEPKDFSLHGTSTSSRVELLRRQYLQMLEPEKLTLPSLEELRLPRTQADIFNVMFNRDNLPFMPPIRYQFRVLKKIIGALEKSIIDPDEDVCFPLMDFFLLMFRLNFNFHQS